VSSILLGYIKVLSLKIKDMDSPIELLLKLALKNFEQDEYVQSKLLLGNALKIQPKNFDTNHLMGIILGTEGKHAEAIPYFEKAIKVCPNHLYANINLGKALSEIGNDHESLKYHLIASKINPLVPEIWLSYGKSLHQLKQFESAIICYEKAINLKKSYAEAWSNKGNSLKELQLPEDALFAFNKALEIKPNDDEIWSNKGNVLHDLNRFEEALTHYDQAIQLNPNNARTFFNKANTLKQLKHYEDAIKNLHNAVLLKPNYSDAYWNQAILELTLGHFPIGWNLYEHRWLKEGCEKYRYGSIKKLDSLQEIKHKTILVWHEQGYGDVIQFSRYIKKLIKLEANVVFEVQPALLSLFRDYCNCSITSQADLTKFYDYQIPLLSLPKLFNTDATSIPLPEKISVDPKKIREWKERLNISNKYLNIGLAVSGNPDQKNNLNRSIPLHHIAPLLKVGNFFLIQKDLNAEDRHFLKMTPEIKFLGDSISDFSDTAAIIENLDIVISVCSSPIHLAGTLQKKSYLLLNFDADWRWLNDDKQSPWYPSVKILRAQSLNAWELVINQLKVELERAP